MLLSDNNLFKKIYEQQDLWQLKFLHLSKFSDFIGERNFFSYNKESIKILWKIGLLRSDFIYSKRKLNYVGLYFVARDEKGKYVYADRRAIKRRERLTDIAERELVIPPWIDLRFHPFRYYLITHLDRILRINIHPLQLLISSGGISRIAARKIKRYKKLSNKMNPMIFNRLEFWHDITELAIVTEPCVYERIFNVITHQYNISFSKFNRLRNDIWRNIRPLYAKMTTETINSYRGELCIQAERLNNNKDLNTLIRMVKSEERLKYRGAIGGAIYLHTMAETLRRGFERATRKRLKEEDELGFGSMPKNLKKTLYSENRVLDSRRAKNFFLQQHGLSFGPRINWYVEGDTEAAALNMLFNNNNAVIIKNLRGKIIEKNQLSFKDSLRHDLKTEVFSLITIDGDREDNIRLVRKAAEEDLICGMFFISKPDFEYCNFTLQELIEIIDVQSKELGLEMNNKQYLVMKSSDCINFKQLMTFLKKEYPSLNRFSKGEEWGHILCRYAIKNPYINNTKEYRPFIKSANIALRSINLNYYNTFRRMKVDPDTGMLVKRNS